jgi:hypothetical protein
MSDDMPVNTMLLHNTGILNALVIGREAGLLIVMYHRRQSSFGRRTGKVWRGIIPLEAAVLGWQATND